MEADLVVLGGTIITLDSRGEVEALAARGGDVVEAGPRGRVEAMIGRHTRVMDAEGLTVVPGLGDGHAHLIATGLADDAVDLFGRGTLARILNTIAKAAAAASNGDWVVAKGFDDTMVVDRRYPTGAELDEVAPDHAVLVARMDGHSCVLNTRAMKLLGLGPPLEGMEMDAHGRPTGVMRHEANGVAQERYDATLTPEVKREAFHRACREALARGLTTVHDIEAVGRDVDVVLATRGETPLRVLLYAISDDAASVPSGCRGLKIFADGSLDSHTGLLHEPYADNPSTRGVFYRSPEAMDVLVEGALAHGLQVMTHAIGDRAIAEILEIYRRHPALPGSPHRLEHYELPSAQDNERCAMDGVVVSTQPAFVHLWDYKGFYVARVGPDRAARIHPYQTLRRRGVVLCGGSDSPVTPLNPLLGIHGAVNHPLEHERLAPLEALQMFTLGVAAAAGEEGRRGTLCVGKPADLTILDANPLEVPQGRIKEIDVLATVVGGVVAHQAGAATKN